MLHLTLLWQSAMPLKQKIDLFHNDKCVHWLQLIDKGDV